MGHGEMACQWGAHKWAGGMSVGRWHITGGGTSMGVAHQWGGGIFLGVTLVLTWLMASREWHLQGGGTCKAKVWLL